MKLRGVTVLAVALAFGAIVLTVWFARKATISATLSEPKVSPGSAMPGELPTSHSAAPAPEVASPESPTPAATPTVPVLIKSSVSPGMPQVRTTPAPSRPVVAALHTAARASASQPEPQADVRAELEDVQFMLRDFRTRMGQNPVGANAEIMRAVMGGNEAKANLGPPAGQQVNERGELVDRWGTPYFFHQLSKISMEVRSAGPDRKMWTSDDLLTK